MRMAMIFPPISALSFEIRPAMITPGETAFNTQFPFYMMIGKIYDP